MIPEDRQQPGPRFLKEPKIECQEFGGRVVSAYIQLADRKAVRVIQLKANEPVYLYLDADGWPVGASIYGHVEGYVVAGLVTSLLADKEGRPQAVGQHVHCEWISREEVQQIVQATERVTTRMDASVAGCA